MSNLSSDAHTKYMIANAIANLKDIYSVFSNREAFAQTIWLF